MRNQSLQCKRCIQLLLAFIFHRQTTNHASSAQHLSILCNLLQRFPVLARRCQHTFVIQFWMHFTRHSAKYETTLTSSEQSNKSGNSRNVFLVSQTMDFKLLRSLLITLLSRGHMQQTHESNVTRAHVLKLFRKWQAAMPENGDLKQSTPDCGQWNALLVEIIRRTFDIQPDLSMQFSSSHSPCDRQTFVVNQACDQIVQYTKCGESAACNAGTVNLALKCTESGEALADEMWRFIVADKCFDQWSAADKAHWTGNDAIQSVNVICTRLSQMSPLQTLDKLISSQFDLNSEQALLSGSFVRPSCKPWSAFGSEYYVLHRLVDSLVTYFEQQHTPAIIIPCVQMIYQISKHAAKNLIDRLSLDPLSRCVGDLSKCGEQQRAYSPQDLKLFIFETFVRELCKEGMKAVAIHEYLVTAFIKAHYIQPPFTQVLNTLANAGQRLMNEILASNSSHTSITSCIFRPGQHDTPSLETFVTICQSVFVCTDFKTSDLLRRYLAIGDANMALNWALVFHHCCNGLMKKDTLTAFHMERWIMTELCIPLALSLRPNSLNVRDYSFAIINTLKDRAFGENTSHIQQILLPALRNVVMRVDQTKQVSALCMQMKRFKLSLIAQYDKILDRHNNRNISMVALPLLFERLLDLQSRHRFTMLEALTEQFCHQFSEILECFERFMTVIQISGHYNRVDVSRFVQLFNALKLVATRVESLRSRFLTRVQFKPVSSEIIMCLSASRFSALDTNSKIQSFLESMTSAQADSLIPDTHALLYQLLHHAIFIKQHDIPFLGYILNVIKQNAQSFSPLSMAEHISHTLVAIGSKPELYDSHSWPIFSTSRILMRLIRDLVDTHVLNEIFSSETVCRLVHINGPLFQIIREITSDSEWAWMTNCACLNQRISFLLFNNFGSVPIRADELVIKGKETLPHVNKNLMTGSSVPLASFASSIDSSITDIYAVDSSSIDWDFDPWCSNSGQPRGISFRQMEHPRFERWTGWLSDCQKISESLHCIYLPFQFANRHGYMLSQWFAVVCKDTSSFRLDCVLVNSMNYMAICASQNDADKLWFLRTLSSMPELEEKEVVGVLRAIDLFCIHICPLLPIHAKGEAISSLYGTATERNPFLHDAVRLTAKILQLAYDNKSRELGHWVIKHHSVTRNTSRLIQLLPFPVTEWISDELKSTVLQQHQSIPPPEHSGHRSAREWQKMDLLLSDELDRYNPMQEQSHDAYVEWSLRNQRETAPS